MSNSTIVFEGQVYYSETSMISFGLNFTGMAVSICGCIVTHYLVKQFGSILSFAVLFMNVFPALNLFLISLSVIEMSGKSIIQFFSELMGIIEFFMIQIMYRLWMLPGYHRAAYIIQWCFFIAATINCTVNIVCKIPTDLTGDTVGRYNTGLLASLGALILLLDILNSLYVVIRVTRQKYYLSDNREDHEYYGFLFRRLPILVLNTVIGITIIVLGTISYTNNRDAVNLGTALIIFLSQYYFWDFKEFALKKHSDHVMKGEKPDGVLDMEGNVSPYPTASDPPGDLATT